MPNGFGDSAIHCGMPPSFRSKSTARRRRNLNHEALAVAAHWFSPEETLSCRGLSTPQRHATVAGDFIDPSTAKP